MTILYIYTTIRTWEEYNLPLRKKAYFIIWGFVLRDSQAYTSAFKTVNDQIQNVQPVSDGILRLIIKTGDMLDVPFAFHFQKTGPCPLREKAVLNNINTSERFVHRYRNELEVAEIRWDEPVDLDLGTRRIS